MLDTLKKRDSSEGGRASTMGLHEIAKGEKGKRTEKIKKGCLCLDLTFSSPKSMLIKCALLKVPDLI